MSYEKDQFGGGSGDITSASVSAALALKQPNFSVADEGVTLTTVAGTVTTINFTGTGISASLTGGLLTVTAVAGAGSGEGSVSVSNMILTALGPYLTSASAASAYLTSSSASAMIASQLSPYITSNSVSIALATYVTSGSLATALGPYVTSGSLTTALGGYVTSTSLATALGGYLTSGSFGTAIAPYLTSASAAAVYVTSASLATALGTYLSSNSASVALATKQPNFSVADEGTTLTTVAGTVTTINFVGTGISASLTGGILTVTGTGGTGSGEGSVSVSNMILTALGPYLTSASAAAVYVTSASLATTLGTYLTSGSFATAITPYLTSASAAAAYITSNSVSAMIVTQLAPYATSNSVSIALATKQPNFSVADEGVTLTTVAGTVTTINFVGTGISASLTGGLLTVTSAAGSGSGEGSVSVSTMISTALGGGYTSTASFTNITLAGRPVGAVLLGYQTLSNVNNFSFSGSWSDFCILECQALYRIESLGASITASAAIYTDGGTTPFLGLATASNTGSFNITVGLNMKVYGGDARPVKVLAIASSNSTSLQRFSSTATATAGYVNAIKYFTSATMTAGMAALYGWRKA